MEDTWARDCTMVPITSVKETLTEGPASEAARLGANAGFRLWGCGWSVFERSLVALPQTCEGKKGGGPTGMAQCERSISKRNSVGHQSNVSADSTRAPHCLVRFLLRPSPLRTRLRIYALQKVTGKKEVRRRVSQRWLC